MEPLSSDPKIPVQIFPLQITKWSKTDRNHISQIEGKKRLLREQEKKTQNNRQKKTPRFHFQAGSSEQSMGGQVNDIRSRSEREEQTYISHRLAHCKTHTRIRPKRETYWRSNRCVLVAACGCCRRLQLFHRQEYLESLVSVLVVSERANAV